jgi:hypothetical protein
MKRTIMSRIAWLDIFVIWLCVFLYFVVYINSEAILSFFVYIILRIIEERGAE